MPPRRPLILGFHIIMTGYGHWLPNDIRGSGSSFVFSDELRELGPIHSGRKAVQPPRDELRRFLQDAEGRLKHPILWFDEKMRDAIGQGIGLSVKNCGYTCYACAVLRNHMHCLIRRHRDDGDVICERVSAAARQSLVEAFGDLASHPVWGRDDHKIFKDSIDSMWQSVRYIEGNPAKEGLRPQSWAFVTPYDGWPYKGS